MRFLHALAVSALVSSARANIVDCTLEPDKCKHADSCDTCGVHPGSEWVYCDSASVLGVAPTVESENGEAGDGGSGYENVMNCRQLHYEFKDTLKASMSKMDAMEMKVTSKREERQDSRRADRDDRLSGMRAKYGLKSNNDGYKDDLIGNDDY
eukprot:gene8960-12184_t